MILVGRKSSTVRLKVATGDNWRAALDSGEAVQFYFVDGSKLLTDLKEEYKADVYATLRNGDAIGMLVPKGTPEDRLPNYAMDYIAFFWSTPDEFRAAYEDDSA